MKDKRSREPFTHTHDIEPGCGCWETTDGAPIGCAFRRESEAVPVELMQDSQHVERYGMLAEVRTANNRVLWVQMRNMCEA